MSMWPFLSLPRKTTEQVFLEHCERGDINEIKNLFDCIEKDALLQGIRISCEKGHHELLMEFLQLGITNHKQDEEDCWMGWTLLHHACEKGQLRIARLLIKHRWSLSRRNLKFQTPLGVASPVVRMMLNLDENLTKVLYFKSGAEISLPHELVTLIIASLLNDTNQSKNNLNELEEDFVISPGPGIKKRLGVREREYSAKVARYHNEDACHLWDPQKWFSPTE
eukprot:TRINITY_DN2691_c0_g1_i4.p1 TRINITY_DN2691_c0_g1~~TRINITY_DN2691_c0_g1_i4.p1  ORF type:complete len:223 (-),score=30.77 TRINITY_DN2691_c0_g1_i4:409-1077(-)